MPRLRKMHTVLRAAIHQECPLRSDQEIEKGGLPVNAGGLSENEGDLIQRFDAKGIAICIAVRRREPGVVEHRELGGRGQRADEDPGQQ